MGKIYNNLISTTAGFNYPAQQPLDDRTVVKSYSDLMILVDSNMTYDGIEVYVVDDEKSYKLINSEWKAIATEDYVNLMINNLHYYCNKDIIYDESLFVIENKVLTIDCSNITDGRLVVPYTIGTHTEVIVIAPENITKIIIPRGIKLTNNVEMTDEALVEMFINLNTIVRIHEDGAVLSFNIAEGAMN